MHGGPPLIYIDPSLTGHSSNLAGKTAAGAAAAAGGYYLGVAHFWEPSADSASGSNKDGRVYWHYFIKVEPQPPFKVLQVRIATADLAGSALQTCPCLWHLSFQGHDRRILS